jgi:hypothetical protein
MGYCTVANVKEITNTKRTDSEITSLINVASGRLNREVQTYIYKEIVTSIDNVKANSVDGSNKDFYTQNWPLGDYDDDFSVSASDVTVTDVNGDTETSITVTSVDATIGKITTTTAPTGTLYITYCYLPRHYPITSEIIKRATAYLAAFMCQSKVSSELASSFTVDRLRVTKSKDEVRIYEDEYDRLINYIKFGDGMVATGGIPYVNK